jgi:hypothetical protein
VIPVLALLCGLAVADPVSAAEADAPASSSEAPDPSFVAPAHLSALDGPFGVLFQPRYRSLATAAAQRAHDLDALTALVPTLDRDARARIATQLERRERAVLRWRDEIAERGLREQPSADARLALSDTEQCLALEAATLQLQLALLDLDPTSPNAPRPAPNAPRPAPAERVSFGTDVHVRAGEVVQTVVVFGADAVIEGKVQEDVVAFGGDVRLLPGGEVGGDVLTLGGRSAPERGAPPIPPLPHDPVGASALGPSPAAVRAAVGALTWMLTLGGMTALVLALAPARVRRVGDVLEQAPVSSGVIGLFGALGLLLAATLATLTLVGIPVALVLLGALASAWLLGLAGLSEAVGARLRLDQPEHGRWIALVGVSALVALLGQIGWVGVLLSGLLASIGVGAALRSRLGAHQR